MTLHSWKKPALVAASFAVLWLGCRYLLPILLPFLVGGGIALAAEPLVRLGTGRLRMPRVFAAGVGVTATLAGILALGTVLGAVVVRELGSLAGRLPDLQDTAQQGMVLLQDWLVELSYRAPEGIQPLLQRSAVEFFDGSSALLGQVTQRLPAVVGTALGTLGSGVIGVGTGVLAAFLISIRLPRLKEAAGRYLPERWRGEYLPALGRMRRALGGWLKAQLKLALMTYVVVAVGFMLLRIPYGPAWAAVVALVDAVPVLGTGTVLVPWAVVWILQGRGVQAMGLLLIYGIAAVIRAVLEPRLVGKHLGLDPLATLAALYVGYRLWGFLGLLLTPILASAAKSLVTARE